MRLIEWIMKSIELSSAADGLRPITPNKNKLNQPHQSKIVGIAFLLLFVVGLVLRPLSLTPQQPNSILSLAFPATAKKEGVGGAVEERERVGLHFASGAEQTTPINHSINKLISFLIWLAPLLQLNSTLLSSASLIQSLLLCFGLLSSLSGAMAAAAAHNPPQTRAHKAREISLITLLRGKHISKHN